MKTKPMKHFLGSVSFLAAFFLTQAWATEPPKMKMTTDIPEAITTPDSVETRLGTLKFFDGFPDDATTQKV